MMKSVKRVCALLSCLLVLFLSALVMTGCSHVSSDRDRQVHEKMLRDLYDQASLRFEKAEFLQAANLYRRGIFLCDSLHLSSTEGIAFYNGLAQVHIRFADYGASLRCSDLALELLNDQTSLSHLFQTWNTRCNVFFYLQEYKNALPCAIKAKQYAAQDSSVINYHVALVNQADILTRLNRYEGIEQMLDSCEAVFSANSYPEAMHYTQSLRGLYALRAEHDLDKAERFLTTEPVMIDEQTMSYVRVENLREFYRVKGDMSNALRIDELLLATKDSLLNSITSLRVADLELQYNDKMREMEIQNSLRRVHFFLVVSFAAIIIMLLLLTVFSLRSRSITRNRDLEVAQMQETLMAEKVRNLRSRISPHYMMNVLRQISGDETVQHEKIELLAKTLRSSLELSDQAVVCLKREVDFVQDYLKLRPQQFDYPVNWQIDSEVDLWQTMIPSMIIQLPVENVLKYAYEAGGPVDIIIRCAERSGQAGVEIIVEDYGRGLPPAQSGQRVGIGLAILTRTISFINIYNNNDPLDMSVTDKSLRGIGQGVKVEFFIPKLWKSPFQS